jgi:hypothetical protein
MRIVTAFYAKAGALVGAAWAGGGSKRATGRRTAGTRGADRAHSPAVTAHTWTPGQFRLFVTHASARKDVAGSLRDGLQAFDIDAFVAHETIAPTTAWQEEIEDALAACHACAAILSDGFKESDWCDQEVGVCFGRGVLVLAIHDGLDPYGFIGKFQAFNPRRYDTSGELCQAIYELLRDNELSRGAMAGAWCIDSKTATATPMPGTTWTGSRP